MRVQENPRLTYAIFNQLIDWSYKINDPAVKLELENSNERAVWFANMASTILQILPGFAETNAIYVSTDSQGEDAFIWKPGTPDGLQQLDYFLRNAQDIRDIIFSLELLCVQKQSSGALEEFTMLVSCLLCVDNNYSRDNLDYLEGTPVSIWLALGTDIYSHFAFGPARDNRVLAALNGPRLRSFLQRLQDSLPLTPDGIDAEDYEKLDLVDRYGFKLPEDPAALAKLLQR